MNTHQRSLILTMMDYIHAVKEYMDQRDEAMSFKCKGGMMDCDGDQRVWLSAKVCPEAFGKRRKKDGLYGGRGVHTDNILGAALAGTSGFTTSEKFEKLGRPELADAPNASRPNLGTKNINNPLALVTSWIFLRSLFYFCTLLLY